jgi:hypothetical protein
MDSFRRRASAAVEAEALAATKQPPRDRRSANDMIKG